jgi:hypothetical protein
VINGLVGLRPGDPLVVNPLVPRTWDYFALENVPYRGHNVTVLWDRTGGRYGRGAGLRVFVDGRQVASRATLGSLTVPVGTAPVATDRSVNDAANPTGTGFPKPFASFTGPIDSTWDAVDGRIYYDDIPHSRWTNYTSPNASDHLGVDFGVPTPVSDVRMYLYDDGGGVRTPAAYRLEYWDGASWRLVPGQTHGAPTGNAMNRITFPTVVTSRIRVVFTNPPGAKVGVTELGAWSDTDTRTPLTVSVSDTVATSTFRNGTGRAVHDVRVRLAVPPGWAARPTTPAAAKVVRPGGRLVTRWTVTPPAGTPPGDYPIRAFTATTAAEYRTVRIPFDPAAYPVADGFTGALTAHQPNPAEAAPVTSVASGALTATGDTPYFGLFADAAVPTARDTATIATIGSFANTGAPEDSVFVGWVKDKDNFVTAWYNHTRRSAGINVRVNGADLNTPGDAAVTLSPGDRFAVATNGDTMTSYAKVDGEWQPLRSAAIGTVLTTPGYHYGVGARATRGTITLTELTGLARTGDVGNP